jgi:hypothetical protein
METALGHTTSQSVSTIFDGGREIASDNHHKTYVTAAAACAFGL